MRIYPAPHYTMGGLWVDYELQTTIGGLFAIGEANFSDHGANRLGASAMMQCLADGYFVAPHTIMHRLATEPRDAIDTDHDAFEATEQDARQRIDRLFEIGGTTGPQVFHRRLGAVMLEACGMSRTAEGLSGALEKIASIKAEFNADLRVDGTVGEFNQTLDYAHRLEDFFELAELMCLDALRREESCGGHFREEHQTEDNEAVRDDEHFANVTAWTYRDEEGGMPAPIDEDLRFSETALATRSYK